MPRLIIATMGFTMGDNQIVTIPAGNSGSLVNMRQNQTLYAAQLIGGFLPGVQNVTAEDRVSFFEKSLGTVPWDDPDTRGWMLAHTKGAMERPVTPEQYEIFVKSLAQHFLDEDWRPIRGQNTRLIEFKRDYDNCDGWNGINDALRAAGISEQVKMCLPQKFDMNLFDNGIIHIFDGANKFMDRVPGAPHYFHPNALDCSDAPYVVVKASDILVAHKDNHTVFASKPKHLSGEEWKEITPQDLLDAEAGDPQKMKLFGKHRIQSLENCSVANLAQYCSTSGLPGSYSLLPDQDTKEGEDGHYTLRSNALRAVPIHEHTAIGTWHLDLMNVRPGESVVIDRNDACRTEKFVVFSADNPLCQHFTLYRADENGRVVDSTPLAPGSNLSAAPLTLIEPPSALRQPAESRNNTLSY